MIVIIDYGMGNVGSILNMLRRIGADAVISRNPIDIENASRIILPGVGAFDQGMKNLREYGLVDVLESCVKVRQRPFLGICLGMQLLTERSEEGQLQGLGWVRGKAVRFKFKEGVRLKVPNMGWNTVSPQRGCQLFAGFEDDPRFYFTHSYHVSCEHAEDIAATTHYGYAFPSAIQHANVFGVQFHPEKSHKYGLRLLENFLCYNSASV